MIIMPESVQAYFSQPAVETAVDLLLASKEPKIPDNLRWDEVSSFYRACLAANQTQAEFAIFVEDLWRGIWTGVTSQWKSAAPAKPVRRDLAVNISKVWEERCFSRQFECGKHFLELSTGLWSDTGIQIGIALWDENDNVVLDGGALQGWAQEGYDMFWTQHEIAPLTSSVDPASFERSTKQAWTAVATAID